MSDNIPGSTELTVLEQMGEAVVSAATGLPPQIQRSFWKAVSRVFVAGAEWPAKALESRANVAAARSKVEVVKYEAEAAAIKANQKVQELVNKESAKAAAREFVKPDLAERAAKYHAAHILRDQSRREEVLRIAVEDIEVNPPRIDSATEIEDDVLESILREGAQRSSEEFKVLFGRILSGEIRRPGSFSLGTIRALGRLDQEAASIFQRLCNMSFAMEVGGQVLLTPRVHTCGLGGAGQNALIKFGLSYNALSRLVEEGLVRPDFNETTQFYEDFYTKTSPFTIGGQKFWAARDESVPEQNRQSGDLSISGPAMTKVGVELRQVVLMEPPEDYIEEAAKWFKANSLVLFKVIEESDVLLKGLIVSVSIVAEDGTISGKAPPGQVPPSVHDAAITETAAPRPPQGKPFTMEGLKMHDVPWDGSVSLRREDLYDGEGRLR